MPLIIEKENPTSTRFWRRNPKAIEKFAFVHYFLPHPVDKKRAGLLSHKSLIIYCLLILAATGMFRVVSLFFPGVLGYASNINTKDLLTYTNKKREESNLSALRLNQKLTEAAQDKASHMFAKNYWAHISPDGTEPWDFILKEGYDYIYAGENLAKNFSTSKDVVQAWYDSPSHRDNLLSPNYDEVGFAVVNGVLDGYETTLVVQMFGRPRDKGQVASVYEEKNILEKEAVKKEATTTVIPNGAPEVKVEVVKTPLVDVGTASKAVSLLFGGFVGSLLSLDLWYSRRKGILKLTGSTFAHLSLLLLVIFCVWFVVKPGIVL